MRSRRASDETKANIAAATTRRYENPEARRKTAQATKDAWVARREKYGPTGRKPKNRLLVSDSEEVLYG
jgi:hypothetical protein